MKKFINTIFGNELKWFSSLTCWQKVRVIYAELSVAIPLCAVSSNILVESFILINAFVALRLCKKIDISNLED